MRDKRHLGRFWFLQNPNVIATSIIEKLTIFPKYISQSTGQKSVKISLVSNFKHVDIARSKRSDSITC